MIPWRVALALQADGWWLRSVIVWHKRSCMPESVTDRATNSWEPIFLLAKSQKYYYDAEAVKEPNEGSLPYGDKRNFKMNDDQAQGKHGKGMFSGGSREEYIAKYYTNGRNQRNVWSLGPDPYSEAHFATFPTEIPKRAILAGTSAKGCCPKCFAPWERVVEKEGISTYEKSKQGRSWKDMSKFANDNDLTPSRPNSGQTRLPNGVQPHLDSMPTRTLGWQPGCKCNAGEPIPCTVLDPFGGSGTTGQVALELGRRAVLVELNPDYVNLIHNRCTTTMGLPLAV
jgi:hypothetical protein